MHNRKLWYGLAALAAAWLFDFLFWGQQGGINFAIWTVVLLVIGYVLAWREGKKPSAWSYLLTVLIVGFALLSAWRSEGLTRFTSILMACAGLILLVTTFLNGHWTAYRLLDYISEMAKTAWAGLSRAFGLFTRDQTPEVPPALPEQRKGTRRLGSVALGLIIALPILLIFGLLLASADPIFSDMIRGLFSIQNLPQYVFRFFYIIIGAYVLAGLYLHAVLPLKPAEKPNTQRASVAPFLGPVEGNIVLGAVDLLFIAFVVIQIRYLFGGGANINATGYTYAEYARKGFGELVAVAVLSLLMYLVFNSVTKRETKATRVSFSVLSIVLIASVLVILASSLLRLLMYEDAYGFSELRTYTHVFIFWLAGLLVAAIVLELLHKRGFFGLALMLTMVGYVASLGLMNVDGFIISQNIQRVSHGYSLDVNYLDSLSSDAVPTMVNAYLAPKPGQTLRDALGAELACRTRDLKATIPNPWQDFRFGENQANTLLLQNQAAWSQYVPIMATDGSGYQVVVGSMTYPCSYYYSGM
jgi:hypothetical protein